MNILGTWKIKTAQVFDKKTFKLVERNADEVLADPEISEDDKQMLRCQFIFKDNGFVYTVIEIPENAPKEEIDAAIASGESELFDNNMISIEKKEWKEVDGKLKFNTGASGEVFGEAIDPWMEITENPDGSIKFMTNSLVRAD